MRSFKTCRQLFLAAGVLMALLVTTPLIAQPGPVLVAEDQA